MVPIDRIEIVTQDSNTAAGNVFAGGSSRAAEEGVRVRVLQWPFLFSSFSDMMWQR